MIKEFIKRYQYIIYVGISFGILDLYIRAVNRGLGFIAYIDKSPILFTMSWILFYIGVITLLNGKIRKIFYLLLIAIFNLLLLTNYVFFKIFGTFFSFNSLSMASEGKGYFRTIFDYIDPSLLIVILLSFLIALFSCKFIPKDRTKKDFIVAIILILIAIPTFFTARACLGKVADVGEWDTWLYKKNVYNSFSDSRKSLQTSGFFEYTTRDLYLNTVAKLLKNDKEQISYLNEYYSTKKINNNGDLSATFEDKNVILILMESTDNWLVTKDRMPTLYNMMSESINFTNHYSPIYGGGATFNSEFIVNSGFMTPFNEESAATQYGNNSFKYSLANLFSNEGYTVNAFHENLGSFYNRRQMSKALGYENYYSSVEMGIDYEESEQDTHLMKVKQIKDLIIPDKGKFFSFVTTYTLHFPYNIDLEKGIQCYFALNETEKKAIKNGGNEEEICLKAQAREADNFFKLLLKELEAKGKLDDTIIIGVADHYTYGYTDLEKMYELKGTSDENLIGEVPFFIWSNDKKAQEVTAVSSNIDILPTIADLFGLDYNANNYIGKNILSDDYEGYVFFKDYSWYDGDTYYKNGQIVQGPDVSKEYIDKMNQKISESLKFNKYILDTDYFAKHQTDQ